MGKSEELFIRAKEVMPGGVNSPVRAFGAVGMTPRFINRAEGSKIFDEDGKSYIDYVCSWGPMILGHNDGRILEAVIKSASSGLSFGAPTKYEVEMAELICSLVEPIEQVRMVNSGTEAVMSALRLARGYTNREKIVKFRGCYHGHCDSMLVNAGSGVLTGGTPNSAGVTYGAASDTLLADYNDLDSVVALFDSNKDIAAIIVEPVAANMGVVAPQEGFLQGLRDICTKNGALLIYDEVITGFRLALGGAVEYFGVAPDLVTYGKIIGAGMPVGAYGGKKEIMQCVAPVGKVYQAGTLSGNPVAMAAGLAMLNILKDDKGIYKRLEDKAELVAKPLYNIKGVSVNKIGSLICPFFTDKKVVNLSSATTSNTQEYAQFFKHMLNCGINLAPAQFEAMFVSNAHTSQDIELTAKAVSEFKITM